VSTILDALKKVERDREAPRDELLDVELPEPRTRRGISTRVIVICASIGFAAGIGLALWRDTAPLQQASAPEPAAPPVIAVPAPPAVPKAKREAIIPTSAPPAAAPAAANPVVAEAAPQASPADQGAAMGEAKLAAVPRSVPPPPAIAPALVPPILGSVDREGSAVEPSPFTAENGAPATAPQPQTPPVRPGRKASGRPVAGRPVAPLAPPPPDTLAAVAPLAPPPPVIAAPPAVAPPPAETEPGQPPQPPPVVIDTGRSPPGSPRVSLTFLQWSADPDRRFAFISIDGAPSQRVREGDTASGMTVGQITQTGVQFQREGQVFMIRPRH
jgi:hypothetical protein